MRDTTFLSLNVNSQNCETKGSFHFSKLTGQTILVVMRISLFIKKYLAKSVKSEIAYLKEVVFQPKLLEKAYFISR